MGKLILVTGGARSGKSAFAEEKVKGYGHNILYIATAVPFDDEMKLRIKKHREQRPDIWETLEAYKDLDLMLPDIVKGKSAVLLDCITVMITNLMFEKYRNWDDIDASKMIGIENYIMTEVEKLISVINKLNVPFVLVTNELGVGLVPEGASVRMFRDIAGRVNQRFAKASQEVFLCVCGIPMKIK
ncbi:bifunctional adenosylcobinamide kinase/adenosylcobinamide-phosphate guanylyltransferase [Pseudobacteroides cellulosolvens]|uniref:Adenosylcobinamide kinase n=1 Tax=Pseudobacteroides cellulosolvens ATCC 35603 = DSM 2933 TaxID=398512 RepID=A0A0L6JQC8_9FIRM|nr:bifunctional adenosylcobinamide kinase/adenosylcobinamide-phosphate guanylyltransferase [Pseudobacteroides cellulosolvens]KNY27994.1 Adenosylcobinamide-phosphate guanylyltransferase [Pseudobacteroides cellulosolvens ATCC 35603 = DSM 2933]